MSKKVQKRFDVLVIGGGPAGMAAAATAAECGLLTAIVDDNVSLGGQIWRGEAQGSGSAEAAKWSSRVRSAGVSMLFGTRVFHQQEPGILVAEASDGLYELGYSKLVLATGARERFLPFPGWTLPNVMGAGGLQAMVKAGLPIRGKRVVVAGTGPLLLAVAAYLRKHGAEIPLICEQTSWANLARFGLALLRQPRKLTEGLQLKRELARVPLVANCWPVGAHGGEVLESVLVSRRGKIESVPCDYLACGFHLVPNIELPLLLGCQIQNGFVRVDDFQRTSVPTVFCAGEPTGIGGVELALVEGEIAGLASAERSEEATRLFTQREKLRHFALALDRAFKLRSALRRLPSPETIVCRCEDVTCRRLSQHTSWRAAKLHTRCGMGPCQGRVCGPVTQFLFKWNPDSVRPPIFPVRVESLAAMTPHTEPEHLELEASEITGGQ
jgi:NADPH-dependent 2,4-dienoyl-CoA reductase/sulfur reductase-like enzyme